MSAKRNLYDERNVWLRNNRFCYDNYCILLYSKWLIFICSVWATFVCCMVGSLFGWLHFPPFSFFIYFCFFVCAFFCLFRSVCFNFERAEKTRCGFFHSAHYWTSIAKPFSLQTTRKKVNKWYKIKTDSANSRGFHTYLSIVMCKLNRNFALIRWTSHLGEIVFVPIFGYLKRYSELVKHCTYNVHISDIWSDSQYRFKFLLP